MKTKYTKLTYFVIFLLVISFVSGFIPLFYLIGFPPFIFLNKIERIDLANLSNIGQFLSGTSGILFSLAAIMAVVLAFLVQRTQINLQKNQISLQKEEIEKNKIKDEILHFENNFYQLLKIHRSILESMNYSYSNNPFAPFSDQTFEVRTGVEAIKLLYNRNFYQHLKNFSKANKTLKQFPRENFNLEYEKFLKNNNNELGHYFRSLYHILKLIFVNKDIIKDSGKFYSNVIRAQLSSVELVFVFFNGISNIAEFNSNEINYKLLIEKYNFFEHLKLREFIQERDLETQEAVLSLVSIYSPKAFGNKYDEIIKSLSEKEEKNTIF